RSRGRAKIHSELAGHDLRERGLTEPRRADEQHVIERLAPRARRFDEPRQVRAPLLLTDEPAEPLRAQRAVCSVVVAAFGRHYAAGGRAQRSILTACAPGCTCSAATRQSQRPRARSRWAR